MRRRPASRLGDAGRLLLACTVSAALAVPLPAALGQSFYPYLVSDPHVVRGQLSLPGEMDAQAAAQADQLIYDFDGQTVTAIGNVQIYLTATRSTPKG